MIYFRDQDGEIFCKINVFDFYSVMEEYSYGQRLGLAEAILRFNEFQKFKESGVTAFFQK